MPKFNDFTDISNILDDYSNDIYESMKEAAKENAQEGVNELKKYHQKEQVIIEKVGGKRLVRCF